MLSIYSILWRIHPVDTLVPGSIIISVVVADWHGTVGIVCQASSSMSITWEPSSLAVVVTHLGHDLGHT